VADNHAYATETGVFCDCPYTREGEVDHHPECALGRLEARLATLEMLVNAAVRDQGICGPGWMRDAQAALDRRA